MLPQGGSVVSLCVLLSSAGAVAIATVDEIVRVNHELTVGSLSALRAGPDLLRALENSAREANEMRFSLAHATCSFFTGFSIRQLSALSVTPISSGPPLKIREQLSLDYLILRQIPRIPVTELS